MILEKKLILDQGLINLMLYEKVEGQEEQYIVLDSLELITTMQWVMDILIRRSNANQLKCYA
eukprot:snap_masked-scaffold_52-processed-gene-1.37-mRNA-1 protein AED:1.00 eAED:1.00 QI:0/0/0/0/1/1/2/0/61